MTSPSSNLIRHRKISRFITSVEDKASSIWSGDWDLEAEVKQSTWATRPERMIGYRTTEGEQDIIKKMEKFSRIGDQTSIYKISRGEEGSKFALEEVENGTSRNDYS